MSCPVWGKAVHVQDSSRGCFFAKGEKSFHVPHRPAQTIHPGEVAVVDPSSGDFEIMDNEKFEDSWVEEFWCMRNPRACDTLRAIPRTYEDWRNARERKQAIDIGRRIAVKKAERAQT